jgi:hypothetical protein
LNTRDPAEAKVKALYISAAMTGAKMSAGSEKKEFNLDDMGTWPSDEELLVAVANNDAIAKVLLDGNPPDKPKSREVEFSKKEVLREEVKIYRQPDHGCIEAC